MSNATHSESFITADARFRDLLAADVERARGLLRGLPGAAKSGAPFQSLKRARMGLGSLWRPPAEGGIYAGLGAFISEKSEPLAGFVAPDSVLTKASQCIEYAAPFCGPEGKARLLWHVLINKWPVLVPPDEALELQVVASGRGLGRGHLTGPVATLHLGGYVPTAKEWLDLRRWLVATHRKVGPEWGGQQRQRGAPKEEAIRRAVEKLGEPPARGRSAYWKRLAQAAAREVGAPMTPEAARKMWERMNRRGK